MIKHFFSALALSVCFSAALAKPFNPRPRSVAQCDGSSLVVSTVGDERYRCDFTSDGLALCLSGGCYYYCGNNGLSSGVLAHNPASRSSSEADFLLSLDSERVAASHYALNHRSVPGEDLAKARLLGPSPSSGASLRSLAGLDSHQHSNLTIGKKRIAVVPVQTQQKSLVSSVGQWDAQLNQVGYKVNGNYGSVHDYFFAQSDGKLDLTFDVFQPVSLSKNLDQLSDVDILEEVLQKSTSLDPSLYDDDADGYIDGIIIITAGGPDDAGGHGTYMGYNYSTQKNGYTVATYIMAPECNAYAPTVMDGIGTICHEFGHMLGLPDLYTVGGSEQLRTPKYWDVMDYGCYLGSSNELTSDAGTHMPAFSAVERMDMGWMDPLEFSSDSLGLYSLPAVQLGKAYLVRTNQSNEFFMIENRQQDGWDELLPGHGLLIWHVQYDDEIWNSDAVNDEANHLRWRLKEAAVVGSDVFANNGFYSFPGEGSVTEFSDFTDWNNTNYGISLSGITEGGGVVCFSTDGSLVEQCPLPLGPAAVPASLTKHGPGSSRQTVSAGESIVSFSYSWTGASGVVVDGLPLGVSAVSDSSARSVVISGSVDSSLSGAFPFTVTTVGGSPDASVAGVITVEPAAPLAGDSAEVGGGESGSSSAQYNTVQRPSFSVSAVANGSALLVVVSTPQDEAWQWSLSNILGVPLLRSSGIGAASRLVSLSGLPKGVCLLRSKVGSLVSTTKVVIP